MPQTLLTYYEIQNTTTERSSTVSASWQTLQLAENDMKNHCDWYAPNGTGSIYEVKISADKSGAITKTRTLVKKY